MLALLLIRDRGEDAAQLAEPLHVGDHLGHGPAESLFQLLRVDAFGFKHPVQHRNFQCFRIHPQMRQDVRCR